LNPRRLAVLLLLGLTLAACADREAEITPVILPPTPELRQRAEAGDAAAQFALAEYYRAIEDDAAMLRWLRESSCRGHAVAQVSLGVLYDAGDGVPQDRLEAYLWSARAAEQGDPDARWMAADLAKNLDPDERAWARERLETPGAPNCHH
jgi:TPR repeat protein